MSGAAHPENVAAIIVSGGAVMAALGYMLGKARKAFRLLDQVETVVTRELEHNHGSSMKDDMRGVAVAVGVTQRRVDDLCDALETLATTVARHHPESADARSVLSILKGLRR